MRKRRSEAFSGHKVQPVQRNARPVLFIGSDHAFWKKDRLDEKQFNGALVFLVPPHDATDGEIDQAQQALKVHGAAVVRTMPRAVAPATILEGEQPDEVSEHARISIRDVVIEMVREVPGLADTEYQQLVNVIDDELTAAGV